MQTQNNTASNEASTTGAVSVIINVSSWNGVRKAKLDYVRRGGAFLKFKKRAEKVYGCAFDAKPGDMFDARGSAYRADGNVQGWAKFLVCDDGSLAAFNFDDEVIALPHWISATR